MDNQNKAIIIENKVYAGDGLEQLQKYDSLAKDKYGEGNYKIFYLTLFGVEASDQSAGEVEYTPISYSKGIINWLEKCVAIAARFPMVRETIIQYINLIKKLTNQDMNTEHREEIVDIIVGNPSFFENAEYIQGVWNDCKRKMRIKVGKELGSIIKATANEFKLERDCAKGEYYYDDFGNEGYTIAFLHKNNWNYFLSVEFFLDFKPDNFVLNIGLTSDDALNTSSETISKLQKIFINLGFSTEYLDIQWIAVKTWQEPSWIKAQQEMANYVFEEIKNIDDVLKNNGF